GEADYRNAGDNEKAREGLNESIRVDKCNIFPRQNRARNLAALGRYGEAITDADAVVTLGHAAEHYAFRAGLHEANNDLQHAISDYDEAIKRQPGVAQYYYDRGRINGLLSRHEESITDLSRAIQLNPRNPQFYYARGINWANAGKCDQAITDYSKAIELSPRMSEAYNNRGVCKLRAGQRDEGMSDYEAALRYQPGNDKARHNLEALKNLQLRAPDVSSAPPVPKFDVPPVKDLLAVPEFKVEEPGASEQK